MAEGKTEIIMKKRIQLFSELIKGYLKTSSIGALFIDAEQLEQRATNPENTAKKRGPSNPIYSSKDCYFLLDDTKLKNIETSHFISLNGVSSLTYVDKSLEEMLSDSKHISITLLTKAKNIEICLRNHNLLFDDIKFIEESFLEELEVLGDPRKEMQLINKITKINEKSLCRRVILIDPIFGDRTKSIASRIFMLNKSNIVIGTNAFIGTERNKTKRWKEVFLLDSQVVTPPPENTYPYQKNQLSIASVTAIINLYKRYEDTHEIYEQLCKQTYPISTIYVWVNGIDNDDKLKSLKQLMPRARFVISDENIGVWARFSFGLNIQTEYTVVFDDDTIPGLRWIENCVETIQAKEALLGTVGLIYNSKSCYMQHQRYGWPAPSDMETEVDIVGHSWFFKTEWLKYYWATKEDICGLDYCGEDMHFSYALQKFGISTVVPPHPIKDRSLWGSLKGQEKGTGLESISMSGKGSHMDIPLNRLVSRGFILKKFQTEEPPE